MTEHNGIKAGYDLDAYEKYSLKLPVCISLQKCPHWLICGNSGSGKSYLTLMLLRNVLKEFLEDVKLWILDFKSSEDFSCLITIPAQTAETDWKTIIMNTRK